MGLNVTTLCSDWSLIHKWYTTILLIYNDFYKKLENAVTSDVKIFSSDLW